MRRAAAVVVVVAGALALSGCGGSAEHVRNICGDVTDGTADLARYDPARPVTALELALGRFDLVEEAVSKARETSLPDHAAAALRTDWLEPAVTSMAPWPTTLEALRTAVGTGDRPAVEAALGTALALGTGDVDTAALRQLGYDACARAFTAPGVDDLTA